MWAAHINSNGQQRPVEIAIGRLRERVAGVPLSLDVDGVHDGLNTGIDKLRVLCLVLQSCQYCPTLRKSVFREQPARRFDEERHHAKHCDGEDCLESDWETPADFVVARDPVEAKFKPAHEPGMVS